MFEMTITGAFLLGLLWGAIFGVIGGIFLAVWLWEGEERDTGTVKVYEPLTPEEAKEVLATYREFHSDIKKWVEEFEDE